MEVEVSISSWQEEEKTSLDAAAVIEKSMEKLPPPLWMLSAEFMPRKKELRDAKEPMEFMEFNDAAGKENKELVEGVPKKEPLLLLLLLLEVVFLALRLRRNQRDPEEEEVEVCVACVLVAVASVPAPVEDTR